jgi:hypothetical protein
VSSKGRMVNQENSAQIVFQLHNLMLEFKVILELLGLVGWIKF